MDEGSGLDIVTDVGLGGGVAINPEGKEILLITLEFGDGDEKHLTLAAARRLQSELTEAIDRTLQEHLNDWEDNGGKDHDAID